MARISKRARVGLPPGMIEEDMSQGQEVTITLFDYTAQEYQEKTIQNVEESFPFKDTPSVTWVNIEGIDPKAIQSIDEHFGIHPLVSEDIVHANQRPKAVDYEEYIFIVLKMIYFVEAEGEIVDEQVSLVLGKNFVISFQEKKGDVFDCIRQRIREGKGRVKSMGADYLAYCLLDAIVDNYFIILEKRGEEIELIDEKLLGDVQQKTARDIHKLKRDMIYLRKQIWPLREVISGLQRNESKLIKKTTGIFLRDVYDHTIQVVDTIESYRDMLTGMHDVYLSSISNRMNEIMKVLTIFAAIFIPLTFVAGIYGMNFDFMPELKLKYGYFGALGLMLSIGLGMLYYFKKKNWL